MNQANKISKIETPVIIVQWEQFLVWLMPVLGNFPKHVRFSFANRIMELALDIIEDLIEARYSAEKQVLLKKLNLKLEKLRVLLRISHSLKFLSHQSYEFATKEVNNTGKMLGGWINDRQKRGLG